MPILLAVLAFLLYPSLLLAVALGLTSAVYLRFAGKPVGRVAMTRLKGQVAYRILSAKLLALNGDLSDVTRETHASLTPDDPETEELRGKLRDAAVFDGEGWKDAARSVRASLKRHPDELAKRLHLLVLQLNAAPTGISPESQERLIEVARLWSVNASVLRESLAKVEVAPTAQLANLR